MKSITQRFDKGFTLIEVIVTIVVIAFVAGMMATFFGQAITQSSAPIERLNATSGLNLIMERITAQYDRIPHWHTSTTYSAGVIILPTVPNLNGFQYTTTAGGTSGASEPAWPIVSGGTISDNTVTWRNTGAAPTLFDLKNAIGTEGSDYNNSFGNYRVVQNSFIKFDASNQEAVAISTDLAYGRFLKVTIGLPTGATTAETRTGLFVMR